MYTEWKLENTERHTESKSTKTVDPKSHHKKEMVTIVTVADTMVVITLQFMKLSNQHIAHLKLTQLCVNYVSIKPHTKNKTHLEIHHWDIATVSIFFFACKYNISNGIFLDGCVIIYYINSLLFQ